MECHIRTSVKADVFTALFQTLRQFSECINLQFRPECMYIQAMDNARISVIEITLPAAWFSHYTCQIPVTLGIHTGVLYKILTARDKSQSIHIQYDPEVSSDRVSIHMIVPGEDTGAAADTGAGAGAKAKVPRVDPERTIFDKHFDTPLIDLECDAMEIPDMEYQVEITLPSMHFATLIAQMRGFGDSLDIRCNEERVTMSTMTTESGKMTVDVDNEDLIGFAIEEDQTVHMCFSLAPLQNISQYCKISKEVELKMHTDTPLRLDYHMDDGGLARYYLAPKMGDNDET
jgi:DNA polymerase III sliding clamp (beta) subunit (PCNA family)